MAVTLMIRVKKKVLESYPEHYGAGPVDQSVFLKQIVSLFISPSVQASKELETIAIAITKLLPQIPSDTAACVAQTLALGRRLDEGMIAAFLRRHDRSTRIVLSEASWLPRSAVLGAASGTRRDEAAAITARADLDLLVLHFLLNRNDAAIDILLAENHSISMPSSIIGRLIVRAMKLPVLAQPLLERPNLSLEYQSCLLPAADERTLVSITRQIAQSFENIALINHHTKPAGCRSHVIDHLVNGTADRLKEFCAQELRVSEAHIARLLENGRGIGLAIILIALQERPFNIFRIFENKTIIPNLNQNINRSIYYIIENLNPVSAKWIINNMASIPFNENETVEHTPNSLPQETNQKPKTDIYEYVKQLRTA